MLLFLVGVRVTYPTLCCMLCRLLGFACALDSYPVLERCSMTASVLPQVLEGLMCLHWKPSVPLLASAGAWIAAAAGVSSLSKGSDGGGAGGAGAAVDSYAVRLLAFYHAAHPFVSAFTGSFSRVQ